MNENRHLRYDRTLSEEKRAVTGSYYTPPEVAELMVLIALSNALYRKIGQQSPAFYFRLLRGEVSQAESMQSQEVQVSMLTQVHETLRKLEVLDLSAGSGVFPLAYLKILSRWFMGYGLWDSPLIRKILKRITVIDIQQEPLSLYKDELHNLYGVKADDLPVYCLDALDTQVLNAYPKLEKKLNGGIDIVLGNPPYLGEKNHKDIFQKLRLTPFGARYYEGRMDYFYYFVYRGIEALKPGGQLCYITTNYFATADGAKGLRSFLKESGHFNVLVNFNDCSLFKDALGQHNVIFSYEKQGKRKRSEEKCLLAYPKHKAVALNTLYPALASESVSVSSDWELSQVTESVLYDYQGMIKMVPGESHQQILEKLRYEGTHIRQTLGDVFYVQQGIVSGYDRDFKNGKGVFVLTNAEAEARPWLKPYLKPFYKNKQIRKYAVVKPTAYEILYLSEKEAALEQEVGAVYEHLSPHRERLSARREVQKKIRPWYALQWPREAWRFEGPLIAAPQRAFVNVFAYEADELYGSADIYYIADRSHDEWVKARTLWTLGYLNSPIVYFWLSLMGKRKGSMLELYASPLKSIPIPMFDPCKPQHQSAVSLVEQLLAATQSKTGELQSRNDLLVRIHTVYLDALGLGESDRAHILNYYTTTGASAAEANYWD